MSSDPHATDARALLKTLRLPLIAAPMYRVSSPELVIEACKAGVIGGFPATNTRDPEELDRWLTDIASALQGVPNVGPIAINVQTPKFGGARFSKDMEIVRRHRVPLVITAVGDPSDVIKEVHAYGGLTLHDVTTLRHAEKAIDAKVDGLNLICGGGGGQSGTINPFAFVPTVRRFFSGLICLAGALSSGGAIRAAQALGCDLVYMGTRFIATKESRASQDYKQMLVDAGIVDLMYTKGITGVPSNFLRPSIVRAGLDPDNLPKTEGFRPTLPDGIRAWRDIWSAGQGIGTITDIPTVAELVARLEQEFRDAAAR